VSITADSTTQEVAARPDAAQGRNMDTLLIAPTSQPADLPCDWEHRGVRLPHDRGRDVLVAPDTIVALLRGQYVGGGRSLSQDVAEALVRAGWAETTFRGHRASYALRRAAR
jgi:hypothetical protein